MFNINLVRRAVAATAMVVLAGCGGGKADVATPTATPVRIATAHTGPAAPPIQTTGLLVNKDEIRLSFKVGGVIRRITVQEGERVKQGQALAELELTEVNAQVEQAKQAHEKARRDAERGERLYADQVISLEQLQDLRTQVAVSDAALKSAQFNSNYAAIVAPRNGTVLRKLAEDRELVAPGNPVIVLGAQDGGFVVRAGLADREIVQIKLKDAAQVTLDALPGEKLSGVVDEIASAADPASGLFNIEVRLDATTQPLKSGLVAKLNIVPATASAGERVYVPIAAIVEGSGRTASVFVLDGNVAKRREVEVAFLSDDSVALLDGVTAGEQVVTDGALYLDDGETVAVQTEAASSLPSPGDRGRDKDLTPSSAMRGGAATAAEIPQRGERVGVGANSGAAS